MTSDVKADVGGDPQDFDLDKARLMMDKTNELILEHVDGIMVLSRYKDMIRRRIEDLTAPSGDGEGSQTKLGVILEDLRQLRKERGRPLVSGAFLEELQDGLDSIAHRQPPSQSPSVAMELLRFAWEHQDSTLIKFAISILEAQTGVKCEKVPPGEHVL